MRMALRGMVKPSDHCWPTAMFHGTDRNRSTRESQPHDPFYAMR